MDKQLLYFVCKWGDKSWMSTEPYLNGTEIGEVHWRGQSVIVKIIAGENIEKSIKKGVEKTHPDLYSLLKSNLQKQIRRCKIRAVATANRMWELNQFELLRRLVVITAEDAEVSLETVTINWLMVAKSKGLLLTDKHRLWVLGYVKALVQHPICRRLELTSTYNDAIAPLDVLNSSHNDRNEITGILFRNAYGGLASDPPMISQCLDWLLETNNPLPILGVKPFKEELPDLLINPAAIDHHIWAGLVREIKRRHPIYKSDFITSVIWKCSSGINYRKNIIPDLKCWEIIHNDVRELTRDYLATILEKYNGL